MCVLLMFSHTSWVHKVLVLIIIGDFFANNFWKTYFFLLSHSFLLLGPEITPIVSVTLGIVQVYIPSLFSSVYFGLYAFYWSAFKITDPFFCYIQTAGKLTQSIFLFNMNLFCVRVCWAHMWRSETTYKSWFSPSAMWGLGIKLGSEHLPMSHLTCPTPVKSQNQTGFQL